ncbi:hypothetical protein E4U11_008535, partial [Claviceps purpurea]
LPKPRLHSVSATIFLNPSHRDCAIAQVDHRVFIFSILASFVSDRPAVTPFQARSAKNHGGTYMRSRTPYLLNLLTFRLWSKVGRLTHYAFDAVLISAFLAGMKRSTGLTLSFRTDQVAGENKDISKWMEKYLSVGEWVMDQSVAIAGSSGFFERRR